LLNIKFIINRDLDNKLKVNNHLKTSF